MTIPKYALCLLQLFSLEYPFGDYRILPHRNGTWLAILYMVCFDKTHSPPGGALCLLLFSYILLVHQIL